MYHHRHMHHRFQGEQSGLLCEAGKGGHVAPPHLVGLNPEPLVGSQLPVSSTRLRGRDVGTAHRGARLLKQSRPSLQHSPLSPGVTQFMRLKTASCTVTNGHSDTQRQTAARKRERGGWHLRGEHEASRRSPASTTKPSRCMQVTGARGGHASGSVNLPCCPAACSKTGHDGAKNESGQPQGC